MAPRLARAVLTALCLCTLALASPAEAEELPDRGVDLHAHMFMEHGLGWLFRGRFDGPLQADDWSDRLSSKANAATLDASGLGVVVVALFAHPVYVADVREGVRRQIRAAKRFVRDNPHWAIAKSPAEARRILQSGRRALVLSLEGAGGVLESEEDLREFVDREGIRIVTALHLVDDRYGGAAQLDGYQFLANPRGIVDQLLDPHHGDDGMGHNPHGLSPLGRRLALELIRRGVWIDLTHASDRAAVELADLAEAAGQPLLITHAQLRSHRPTERATPAWLLKRVAKSGGVIGLLPSEDGLTETASGLCPAGCAPEACQQGVNAFAAAYQEAASLVGADSVLLGTDFNGGMRHLDAACGTTTALDQGLVHQGQLPLLWQATAALGVEVPSDRARLARFLDAWSQVVPRELDDDEHAPQLPEQAPSGPSIAAGLGFAFATGDTEGGAMLPQAMLRIRKDHADDVEVEPMFYLLHARGELAKTFDDDRIPYAQAVVAPFGVELVDADNRLVGEGPQLLYRRHIVLGQRRRLRAAAFSGLAQSMIGLWKSPPSHDLFVAFKLDLLGYEGIQHVAEERPDLHGLFLANGGLGFGASLAPKTGWRVRLRADAEADITLLVGAPGDGPGYQTDVLVGGGLEVGTQDRRFTQLLQMRWYATRERTDTTLDRSTPHVRAGVKLGF